MKPRTPVAFLATLALACGGGQTHPNLFSTNWSDDSGASVAALLQKIGSAKPAIGVDVAVAVAGNSDKVVGISLAGGTAWSFSHAVDVRPTIAGSIVVGEGGGELFCLDAASGKELWARQVGPMKMRGAGDDGKTTIVSLTAGAAPGSVLLAIDRDGSVARQIESEKALGVPTILAGYAFVPWGNQYVSVLDLTSGEEAARILLRGKVSHAFATGGSVFFGEQDLFRFDDKIKDASRNLATHLVLPQRELPGMPSLMAPGDETLGPVALALDKTRMYARPASDALGFDSGRFYGTYFRLAMAFDAKTTKLAWVHDESVDLVGGAAGPSSFVFCNESGKVIVLDATTGGVERELSLGEPIKSCTVQADGLASSAPQPAPPLADQISAALTNRDSEMIAGQRLLLRELATLEDESVTKTLVDLTSNPLTVPVLLAEARRALATRRNGAPAMLAALARHYDFLHDVLLTPPVGPIALALAAMKDKRAAPLLAAHLLDPADSDDDVKQAAAALAEIGDASQAPALTQFLAHYHASANSEDVATAVVSSGQALLTFGGPAGRKAVDAALADPMTVEMVKSRLSALEQQLDARKK